MGKRLLARPLDKASNLHYKFIRFLPGRVYNKLIKGRVAPPIDVLLGTYPDVMLWPNFVSWPTVRRSKNILIIYDLSYIHQAEHSDRANRQYLKRFVPRSIKKAAHIITISQSSQHEILSQYGVEPSDITIINPAVDHQVYRPQSTNSVERVSKKYGLGGAYILYTGTIEPRKNIVGILNAYELLPQALRSQYVLVLAGGKGWLDQHIQQRLSELKDLKIITTGYVPDEDLPAIYSGAAVFVYPSFYEGFGMPPLEAMACGVPVITSNNSSLPEVVGDAGIMVQAEDAGELAKQMERVLTDPKLAAELRKKGLLQAQKFNWEDSAKRLLEVIERVKLR